MRRVSMRPAGRILEASDKDGRKMYSKEERTKKQGAGKTKEEKRGELYNFLQSLKWGPFWQQAAEKPQNGATGFEGWRRGLRKGQGRRRERRGGRRKERVQTAGFNQQQAAGNEITIPLLSD